MKFLQKCQISCHKSFMLHTIMHSTNPYFMSVTIATIDNRSVIAQITIKTNGNQKCHKIVSCTQNDMLVYI